MYAILTNTIKDDKTRNNNEWEVIMSALKKRKTYSELCPVCGGEIHPLSDETIFFDELATGATVLAEVSPGHWVKVIERRPAKT